MIFAFTGFSQDGPYRVFSFELLPRNSERGPFHVRADMALARSHGISLQELPALCRALLENQSEAVRTQTATYSAAEMMVHANARAAAAEDRKARKSFPPRRTADDVQ